MAGIGVAPVVFLLLLAIGGAQATLFNIQRPVTVTGQICCTQNGNCPGTPVVGAPVILSCSGSFLNPGVAITTTTTATGSFSITATVPIRFLFLFSNVIPCVATVQLPLSTAICPVLSTTNGRLIGPIIPTGQVAGLRTGTVQAFLRSPL